LVENRSDAQKQQADQMKKMMGYQMLPMLMSFVLLIIIANPSLRGVIGGALNDVFMPVFGFHYAYPLISILISGIIIGLITSIPRYFFTDWIRMGKAQLRMRAFQKVMREAYRSGQKDKIQKLSKMQSSMMMEQNMVQMNQMKPLMVLSIFTFLIVIWLFYFISALPYQMISVPWSLNVNIATSHLWVFPAWIEVEFIASLVIGYFVSMIIKFFDFSYRLKKCNSENPGQIEYNAGNN
jgi:uncharacterized membrane protein (DUF106 family)